MRLRTSGLPARRVGPRQRVCRVSYMLDRDGYRPNVGIIIVNHRNQVFWGKRVREHSWQFPQGGIKPGESPEQAINLGELDGGGGSQARSGRDPRPYT